MPAAWRSSGIVTLLSDFGAADAYVGAMKGVIVDGAPELRHVIDLVHDVPPQDVRAGAFHLRHAWRWFPEGTVHVAVVDPGVGSLRDVLLATAAGHAFLAPDNGLLAPTLADADDAVVRRLDVERVALPGRSRTFHGRDVFAPAAARLAAGEAPDSLGEPLDAWHRIELPEARRGGDAIEGEVLLADRFGNLVTNVPGDWLDGGAHAWNVELGGRAVPLVDTYADAQPGTASALIDSYGLLEVAVPFGSAATVFGVVRGAKVCLRRTRG